VTSPSHHIQVERAGGRYWYKSRRGTRKTQNQYEEGGSDIDHDSEEANSNDDEFENNSLDLSKDCEICKAKT
jgi:hypothetical protein